MQLKIDSFIKTSWSCENFFRFQKISLSNVSGWFLQRIFCRGDRQQTSSAYTGFVFRPKRFLWPGTWISCFLIFKLIQFFGYHAEDFFFNFQAKNSWGDSWEKSQESWNDLEYEICHETSKFCPKFFKVCEILFWHSSRIFPTFHVGFLSHPFH